MHCYLLSLVLLAAAGPEEPAVNYNEHVGPLLLEKCAGCHRPGEGTPFSLLTYDDARKRAHLIGNVTESGYMPPWPPKAGWGHFQDDRRLAPDQVDQIAKWVEAGTPEGPADRKPTPPTFPPDGWHLGTPDLVLTLSEPFEVPADGADIYRMFVLPNDLTEDHWVTAVEIRPENRSVVHHALYFLDSTGGSRKLDAADPAPGFGRMGFTRTGTLGGWAVGATPRRLPLGLAYPFPKGSDLVVQMHFHPDGKPHRERTSIGLYFAKEKPSRQLLGTQAPLAFGAGTKLRTEGIAPGDRNFVIEGRWEVPFDIDVVAIGGHAHYLCRTMKATAELPDGQEVKLFAIDDWDFNWQGRYNYVEPVRLPKGAIIHTQLTYDNSADNPRNPSNPPKHVSFGEASTDEMGSIGIAFAAANEADIASYQGGSFFIGGDQVGRLGQARRGAALLREMMGGEGNPLKLRQELESRDVNHDGKLTGEEIPPRLRVFADRIDADGDGALSREEIRDSLRRFLMRQDAGAPDEKPGEPEERPAKPEATPAPPPTSALEYRDLDGRMWQPMKPPAGAPAQVLVFVTPDCPVANHYAPEIARLAAAYHERHVPFLIVHVDPAVTKEAAQAHAAEYGLEQLPILLDPEHKLVERTGVKVTPEVAVIRPEGQVAYCGRIDDRFGTLGRQKPQPSSRELAACLDALLAGQGVANSRVAAIGCPIADLKARSGKSRTTRRSRPLGWPAWRLVTPGLPPLPAALPPNLLGAAHDHVAVRERERGPPLWVESAAKSDCTSRPLLTRTWLYPLHPSRPGNPQERGDPRGGRACRRRRWFPEMVRPTGVGRCSTLVWSTF